MHLLSALCAAVAIVAALASLSFYEHGRLISRIGSRSSRGRMVARSYLSAAVAFAVSVAAFATCVGFAIS